MGEKKETELDQDQVDEQRDRGLPGIPDIKPSPYICTLCDGDVQAQDVVWDRENRPHCPQCGSILKRRSG